MAGHLLGKKFSLTVHSRTRSKCAELEARGAVWAESPAAAAREADIVCICVTDTPDVESVIVGEDGIIHSARPGTIVIDHSTISPLATQNLATRLAAINVSLLDAPLSGGDVGARNGTLSIMVGGDADSLERAMPVLQSYGKTITHCGGPGTGQFTKLVNQVLICGALGGVCEALHLAKQAGLDLTKTIAATTGGAAGSWQLANLGPKIAAGDYAPGFMIDLIVKDLRLVAEAMAATGVTLPIAAGVTELFKQAQSPVHGREGTQALFHAIIEAHRS